MGRQAGKINIALLAAAVLLCLTLFTTCLISGLYARYTTSAQSDDKARVAAFVFDVDAGTLTVALPEINKPGEDATVKITISNKRGTLTSEVAECYTMTIRELGNLPLTYTLTEEKPHTASPDIGELKENGTFAASVEATKTYTLTVTWPDDDDKYKDPKYAGGTASLKLTIIGEQVD